MPPIHPEFGDAELRALGRQAEALGLLRLGAVSLDDPGFEPSRATLRDHVERGLHGEMGFMARTLEVRLRPEMMLEGAKTVLVAAVPYRGEAGPIARYAQSVDYHTAMYPRLEKLGEALRRTHPSAQTLVCIDTKPLPERAAATLAGLGFLGKNGCLIVPGLGSYVLLGALLTDLSFSGTAARPADFAEQTPWDACGQCRACLDACPTHAFESPGHLDPRRCIAYLTIEHRGPVAEDLMANIGERVAGCDLCQEVCPYNRSKDLESRVPHAAWLPQPEPARDPQPLRLLGIGSNQHKAFVKGTALNRIPRRALRRNAAVALGNRPGPPTAEERAALERAAADTDPHVAQAARWALLQHGIGSE